MTKTEIKTKKDLILVPAPYGSFHRIQFEGGGQLPEKLHGVWTIAAGKVAINGYNLERKHDQDTIKIVNPSEALSFQIPTDKNTVKKIASEQYEPLG